LKAACLTKEQFIFWLPVGWQRHDMPSKKQYLSLKRACSSRPVLKAILRRAPGAPSASAS